MPVVDASVLVHALADQGGNGDQARLSSPRENVSAYDAAYVALAEALDAELVTADARLAAAPGLRCPVTLLR